MSDIVLFFTSPSVVELSPPPSCSIAELVDSVGVKAYIFYK